MLFGILHLSGTEHCIDFFLTEVYLVYNSLLFQVYSKVIQSYFFKLFSIMGYYKMLNIIPCAIQ